MTSSYEPVVVYFDNLLCLFWLDLSSLVSIGWVAMEEFDKCSISIRIFVHFEDGIIDGLACMMISLTICQTREVSNSLHCSGFVAQNYPE